MSSRPRPQGGMKLSKPFAIKPKSQRQTTSSNSPGKAQVRVVNVSGSIKLRRKSRLHNLGK